MTTYSIHFEDERDFLRFASILLATSYFNADDALARLNEPEKREPHGERTWGRVSASAEEATDD